MIQENTVTPKIPPPAFELNPPAFQLKPQHLPQLGSKTEVSHHYREPQQVHPLSNYHPPIGNAGNFLTSLKEIIPEKASQRNLSQNSFLLPQTVLKQHFMERFARTVTHFIADNWELWIRPILIGVGVLFAVFIILPALAL